MNGTLQNDFDAAASPRHPALCAGSAGRDHRLHLRAAHAAGARDVAHAQACRVPAHAAAGALDMKPGARPAEQELEEILQFVYLMPVGVLRLGPDGTVEMINPKAVQLLQNMDVDSGQADGMAILDALG